MDLVSGVILVGFCFFLGRWSARGAPAKKRISKKIRSEVWEKSFPGKKKGRCLCCSRPVQREEAWHCSHVVSEAEGGKIEVSNLEVCCPTCNLKMGKKNLLEYKKTLEKKRS